jgi:hypothetical protein
MSQPLLFELEGVQDCWLPEAKQPYFVIKPDIIKPNTLANVGPVSGSQLLSKT